MNKWGHIYTLIVLLSALLNINAANAQINAYTIQGFNFGNFYQGISGGTVSVSAAGVRTSTGDIVLMNNWQPGLQAVFEITAPEGATISILTGTDSILAGSNGGTITLHLEGTDVGSPFTNQAVSPARTRINVAGKLIVGSRSASPPGTYQGTCYITFNQE